jgi:hypothetical protein
VAGYLAQFFQYDRTLPRYALLMRCGALFHESGKSISIGKKVKACAGGMKRSQEFFSLMERRSLQVRKCLDVLSGLNRRSGH